MIKFRRISSQQKPSFYFALLRIRLSFSFSSVIFISQAENLFFPWFVPILPSRYAVNWRDRRPSCCRIYCNKTWGLSSTFLSILLWTIWLVLVRWIGKFLTSEKPLKSFLVFPCRKKDTAEKKRKEDGWGRLELTEGVGGWRRARVLGWFTVNHQHHRLLTKTITNKKGFGRSKEENDQLEAKSSLCIHKKTWLNWTFKSAFVMLKDWWMLFK